MGRSESVRSSLPGRWLNGAAALAAVSLAFVIAFGKLSVAMKNYLGVDLEKMPVIEALLIGVFLLTAAFQILLEIRAFYAKKAAEQLARKDVKVPYGYFRIGPYGSTDQEQKSFKRPDRAEAKILSWIQTTEEPLLYLTGESGTGKTSILRAFVMPHLESSGWSVINTRAWQDPESSIASALSDINGSSALRDLRGQSLADNIVLEAGRQQSGLVVILDQFEEFLILTQPRQQLDFINFIDKIIAENQRKVRLLLVFRLDYIANIEEANFPRLRHGENWTEVGSFTHFTAFEFMKASKIGLSHDALEILIKSASELDNTPGIVRPISLNVLGYIISSGPYQAASLDAYTLITRYITQSLGKSAIRKFAPFVLGQLLTRYGTKQPQSQDSIAGKTGLRLAEVRAVLNALTMDGLARPLNKQQTVWELSHDFVATAVTRYLGRRGPGVWRQATAYSASAVCLMTFATVCGWYVLKPSLPTTVKPIAYFSGDRSALDSQSNVQNGHLVGKAGFAPDPDAKGGNREAVFSFPALGSYLEADADALPKGAHARTLALWAYLTALPTPPDEAFFAGYGRFRKRDSAYLLEANDDRASFSNWANLVSGGEPLSLRRWYFVAVTTQTVTTKSQDITSLTTLYLDGEPVQWGDTTQLRINTLIDPHAPPIDTKFLIGDIPDDGTDPTLTRNMTGFIKYVSIYDYALSGAQIRYLYRNPGST